MKVIQDLWEYLKEEEKTLISNTHEEEYLDYIIENSDKFDPYYLSIKYPSFPLISDDMDEILDTYVESAIAINAYKWSKIWDTLNLEYNPIWNYDGETITTEERDARKEETEYGAKHEEYTTGGSHAVTDDRTAPYDSSTVRDTHQSETTADEHVDERDEDERTDTKSADAYTDKITEVKHGNQGTTTTQKMIQEEREVALMDYVGMVYKDIIEVITYPYFV